MDTISSNWNRAIELVRDHKGSHYSQKKRATEVNVFLIIRKNLREVDRSPPYIDVLLISSWIVGR